MDSPPENNVYNETYLKFVQQQKQDNKSLQLPPIQMQTSSDEVSPSDELVDGELQHPQIDAINFGAITSVEFSQSVGGINFSLEKEENDQESNTLFCDKQKHLMQNLIETTKSIQHKRSSPGQVVQILPQNCVQNQERTHKSLSISDEVFFIIKLYYNLNNFSFKLFQVKAKKMKLNI